MRNQCPQCNGWVDGIFPTQCPFCSLNINTLSGSATSNFANNKWQQHTTLLSGTTVPLFGKTFNASFDYNGLAKLTDLLQFALTYGDRTTIPDSRGINNNLIIVAYTPEVIGSGSAIHYPALVPCSGVMVMSPNSQIYAHSFPVIDEWVQNTIPIQTSFCRICASETGFGVPVCNNCYIENDWDWQKLLSSRK